MSYLLFWKKVLGGGGLEYKPIYIFTESLEDPVKANDTRAPGPNSTSLKTVMYLCPFPRCADDAL